MQVVSKELVNGKKVLLRLDLDVPLGKGTGGRVQVTEDFRLRAALPTVKLCLENASSVVAIGHVGRPEGKVVAGLSMEPIRAWFKNQGFQLQIEENLRFNPGEDSCDLEFAKKLAQMGNFYINEAFAAHHKAASTTVLPTLLLHAAGLRFASEVEKLTKVRENPKKPFVAIMGGAKVEDKLPVIQALAQRADAVLVGGKLIHEIREKQPDLPKNVMVGKLNEDGFDIAAETVAAWAGLISKAAMIVWNGPLGKFEDPKYDQTKRVIEMILESSAEVIIGGGDSVAALNQYGLLEKAEDKAFVSVGGGAMLKFLSDGTLPTVDVLT